jgi:hypothetical protein
MNIIKLQDIILDETWGLNKEEIDLFNKHLKGKYAYWIHMRYIVSFDHMRHEGYLACEEDINKLLKRENGTYPKPYGAPSIDIYDWMDRNNPDGSHLHIEPYKYVDMVETDRINNTIDYRLKNSFVPEQTTIEDLKKFRTWLAVQLLKHDQTDFDIYGPEKFDENDLQAPPTPIQKMSIFSAKETHILEYYANNMTDQTILNLMDFAKPSIGINNITTNSCGCSYGADLSNLYNTQLTACDPISIYRKGIYNGMVEMFSKIDFWTRFESGSYDFIDSMKQYIDDIIKCNLPLSKPTNSFEDCPCSPKSEHERLQDILKRLSISLGYITSNQVLGHKNYITDALTDWAKELYEIMYW